MKEEGRNCALFEAKFLYTIKIKLAIQIRLFSIKMLITIPRATTRKNNLKYIIKERTWEVKW